MSFEFKFRSTISRSVGIQGKGLHTGAEIKLKLIPASVNSGIVIRNTENNTEVKVNIANVSSTRLATTVGSGSAQIHTIEHFLAACAAWGVDDLIVELAGPEFPIMDGSASAFVFLLERAGRKVFNNSPKTYLKIKKEIIFQMGKSYFEFSPSSKNSLQITGSIDFDHPKIKNQKLTYVHSQENFLNELCSARTFCFVKDIEKMRSMGLIKGGCLQSALVLNETDVVNPEGLRFSNEFVRHKILDCIGDLYTAGYQIIGSLRIHCPGHELNRLAVKTIMEDPSNYEIVVATDEGNLIPDAALA